MRTNFDPGSQLETQVTIQITTQVNSPSVWQAFGRLLLRMIVAGIVLIPLAMFLLSLLAPYFFWGELLTNFRLQISIMMLAANGLLLIKRKRWLSLGYFLLVIVAGWKVFSIYLPASQPAAGERQIKVMTFNLFNKSSNPIDDVQVIKDWNADILLLTEYTSDWSAILQSLKLYYPYSMENPRWHGYGIALFSKFPLTDQRVVNLTELTDVPLLMATAEFDQHRLTIIGVHTVSPVTSGRMEIRNKQLEMISKQVPQPPSDILLLGDLNCVPWSTYMLPLTKTGLRDSRQGIGFHPTWNRNFGPFKIPIDHCFVSESIHVHDRVVGSSYGSDHFPVITTISISNQKPETTGR